MTGSTGPLGPAGATGETGRQGSTGQQGATGERGQRGFTGDQGQRGDKGNTGEVSQAMRLSQTLFSHSFKVYFFHQIFLMKLHYTKASQLLVFVYLRSFCTQYEGSFYTVFQKSSPL